MLPPLRACPYLLALAILAAGPVRTAPAENSPSMPARELVRKAVQNEAPPNLETGPLFAYKSRLLKPHYDTVKQNVETPLGILARVVMFNGQLLTAEQKANEDARINRLLDPAQMQQKRKAQQADAERAAKLFKALPDAFLYEYLGSEQVQDRHTLVKLSFTPDPAFDPPTRETLIFQGMRGEMVVDSTAMRVISVDGTLFRDVTIGWGLIGRLYKGGRFTAEQTEVAPGCWTIVKMTLKFEGRALIFKSLHIDEVETLWDFKPVERMSVHDALDYLKQRESQDPQPRSGQEIGRHK